MNDAAPAPSAAESLDFSRIAEWAATDEGKAMIAQAIRDAEKAGDELSEARRVDPAIMHIPMGVVAQPAEPPAMDDLVARLSVCAPSSVADDAIAELQRQARELARWNELHRVIAEELDCDQETWPDHRNAPLAIGATFVLIKQRAERAEAERDALREVVRRAEIGK